MHNFTTVTVLVCSASDLSFDTVAARFQMVQRLLPPMPWDPILEALPPMPWEPAVQKLADDTGFAPDQLRKKSTRASLGFC